MNHKRPPIPVIVILILAVLVGGYFGIRALLNKGSNALTASGTIETVEVTISPEIGGKVAEVSVDEGASVKVGDMLFRLDDTLLQAQRSVAAASLDLAGASASSADAALTTAQANYNLALNAARLESAATRTAGWRAANPAGYTLPGGYFSAADEITAAQTELDAARFARDARQDRLNTLLADPANANFGAAEIRLVNARAAYLVAQDVLTRASATNNTDLRQAAQSASDTAKTELDNAQAAYDGLKDTDPARNITVARADVSAAQERYEAAQDHLLALQTGEYSPKLTAAQAALHQAQTGTDQAHLAVTQAEANLALLDVQIGKLTVKTPADGAILMRSIQPGEIVAPSAVAMTLGRLANLTITVYVPEDRYGELSLGQSASLTVDSFPGDVFTVTVIHIADQAEFTPRNVQTVAGRSSTVFAIKLQVQDPNGKLKPGMPADVTFEPASK
jgi:HlyD family secretion protein